MKPLVSILIPAYNPEAWIAGTIKSSLAQTWPRKEIIIVDDGSTDQTFVVARRLASKDVAVVTRENQFLSGEAGNCAGVGKARHESRGPAGGAAASLEVRLDQTPLWLGCG
jgi:cellulose synthase/poly-beta-1,6-N-acetylglucosamine synthase-like glycosyltransferase